MLSATLCLVLSQVVAPQATPQPELKSSWPVMATWLDGQAERTVHLDESLVAERDGDEHTGASLRSQGAMISLTRGRMRIWRVERATAVLTSDSKLLPVYRDEGGPRLRVPIGGVLVVPAKGVSPAKVREAVGGEVVKNGVVRVPCAPAQVFELARTLSATPGVWWVQPDWWLAAQKK